MLYESPSWDLYNACLLERIVQIGYARRLLRNLEPVAVANPCEMPLEHHSGESACSPRELVLGKLFGCVEFRVEEIPLDQLPNVEERALEASFHRLQNRQLLAEMWDRGLRTNNFFLLPPASHIESLQVVLDYVVLVGDFFTRFRFLVVSSEICKPVWQELPD